MKYLALLFGLFLSGLLSAQDSISAILVEKIPFENKLPIDMDGFGNLFYVEGNNFVKHTPSEDYNYSNVQLGNISSANVFNSLKPLVFYRDFNTVVVLDNRLAEVFKIDFNLQQPYKNVTAVSAGFDNTVWVFNQDLQQLELFDYKTRKTRASTLPVSEKIVALTSNYNYCWLLTENYLYQYNYVGSLISKTPLEGFSNLSENNGNLVLQQENQLFYLSKNTENIIPVVLPDLSIKHFFASKETLYIYNAKFLYKFHLKTTQ